MTARRARRDSSDWFCVACHHGENGSGNKRPPLRGPPIGRARPGWTLINDYGPPLLRRWHCGQIISGLVRDPLLALGCTDPVERIAEAKRNDPRRQRTAEVLNAWWKAHKSDPVTIKDLDLSVLSFIDPQNRGRQYVAAYVASLAGTRLAGLARVGPIRTSPWDSYLHGPRRAGLKRASGAPLSAGRPHVRERRTRAPTESPTEEFLGPLP